jgi:protease I
MATNVNGKKSGILFTTGLEQSELTEPRKALEKAGVETTLVSCRGEDPGHEA